MLELGPLTRVLGRVRSRLRTQHALQGLALASLGGLLALALGLLGERLQAPWLRPAAWLAGLSVVLGGLAGALWPVPLARAADQLDHSHALKGRLRSSLEFAGCPAPSAFMEATLRETHRLAAQLSPARAVPIHWPAAARLLPVPAALLLLAAFVPLPQAPTPPTPPQHAHVVTPVHMDADTLRAFRQDLSRVAPPQTATEPEAARYAQLLEALGRGHVGRDEALETLDTLLRRLSAAGEGYTRVVRAGLARMARGMGDGRLTGELMEALADGDAAEAAAALEELARRLSQGTLDAHEREALRSALERAAQARAEDGDSAEPQLLQQDEPNGSEDEEPSLLNDPEDPKRQLEELRREHEARERARRQLEELRRELGQAGAAGAAGKSQQAMEQAARQLQEMAGDGLSREQRRKLAEQMEQLRQQLQRQTGGAQRSPQGGQGGESQQQRLERFRLQAGGDQQQQGTPILPPRSPSDESDGGKGDAGSSTVGDGGTEAGPEGGQRALQLGGEGEPNVSLEMPGMGGQESGRERQPSSGSPDSRDPEARPDATHEDSHVAGVASRGPSRSQVILGAADEGFSSAPYEQVYGEYRNHAEGVLERDQIPPGYRFYVRRYFQLIRPREGSQDE